MKTPIKAAIFDRDGVLVWFDIPAAQRFLTEHIPLTLPAITERWYRIGATHGWPKNFEEELALFRAFWGALGDELGLAASSIEALNHWHYSSILRPYPEARRVLTELRAQGIKIGVLSNFSLASIEHSLVMTGLDDLVDGAYAASVIGVAKPDPEAYRIVARRLGVEPEECLFFDDEHENVVGARAVGMQAFWLNRERQASTEALSLATLDEYVQHLPLSEREAGIAEREVGNS